MLGGHPHPFTDLAACIARTHHERWDGTGYPRGLRGEEIPLAGRIVAVADVFDALTSDRSYRPGMGPAEALQLMAAGAGSHFDPRLMRLFTRALPRVLTIRERHVGITRPTFGPALALAASG
jgi:putative two-component system response regulator